MIFTSKVKSCSYSHLTKEHWGILEIAFFLLIHVFHACFCHFFVGASFSDSFHLSVKIYGRAKDSSYHLIAETPFNRTRQLQCQKV